LTLGRYICGDWQRASSHEWLVTNGLGGFACGTVAGANTRRYHGFLLASLKPPVERTLLIAKLDLSVDYLGTRTELSTNEFEGGTLDPLGLVHLESFEVRDGVPTWRYAVQDALLEQQIFMAPGANTSYLRLELLRASAPLCAGFRPFVTYRDYHSHGRGAKPYRLDAAGSGFAVSAFDGARPFRVMIDEGEFTAASAWYWNFFHRAEAERGLDALEDLWMPGTFSALMAPRRPVYLIGTCEAEEPAPGAQVLDAVRSQSQRLIGALPSTAPRWIRALARASDQFIVRRGNKDAGTFSIIAGYPWFADWGRDTMIALPGLATALGRYDAAAAILRTYARFADRGMLPNRLPEGGEPPEYNTADASLWLFDALRDYLEAKRDPVLVNDLFPTLSEIIHAHVEGTRFGIHVDPTDGLLRAGEPGTQLTWMDAKHGDRVFTPRIGKPVEINALWLNALDLAMRLAAYLRASGERDIYRALLSRASANFHRFWNAERGCLFDVIDVDGGVEHDASLRPNQILAVSLPYCALPGGQMRAVVDCCARDLVTSYGVRSLSPTDPAYIGRYTGDSGQRDAAYHQGTAWSWLLGPFARAHYRVYGEARLAQTFIAPIAQHLTNACVGSVSEIFDGEAPHLARGCFAQAWSVAEILRSWVYLERKISAP
jgi:predicted glycogen debranching enzyme